MAAGETTSGTPLPHPTDSTEAMEAHVQRVRRKILARVNTVDGKRAAEMLGIEPDRGDAELDHLAAERLILRVEMDREWHYPLFQFDHVSYNVLPVVVDVLQAAPRDRWSMFQIMDWLTTPNMNFGGDTPEAHIRNDAPWVIKNFLDVIVPAMHG